MDSENIIVTGPGVLLAVFVGLAVVMVTFFVKWIKQEDETPEKTKNSSTDASGKHSKKEQTNSVKTSNKKKLTERESRRNARANEKAFNHPWLMATLKGHTGRVLDMDYSANGKYLVSCGDEDPDPDGPPPSHSDTSSVSSDSTKESQEPSPVMHKGLTRRQRKNKKNAQKEPKVEVKSTKKVKVPNEEVPRYMEPGRMNYCGLSDLNVLDEYKTMSMPECVFVQIMKDQYSLTKQAMGIIGYPLRPEWHIPQKRTHLHDFHSRRFYYNQMYINPDISSNLSVNTPNSNSGDSGNASNSSSEEEEMSTPKCPLKWKDARSHVCDRCGSFFYTTSKSYITQENCYYHPGKLRTMNGVYGPLRYTCCYQAKDTFGCQVARVHVWRGPTEPIVNSCYVETDPPKTKRSDNNHGIYALDCEMSYTVTGLEVVKVTVVDISGRPVYNEFVRPINKVVDYNTRYSGVSEDDFSKNPSKTLVQVQRDLKKFISSETVLVGHALENDFKGLKLLHKTVVDTAFTFPHYKGLPFKRSLRSLARSCLNKEIQKGVKGHDSFEDARTCMELMLSRVRYDFPDNF